MSYFMGTTSYGTTGVKTITCGFQPVGAKITIGAVTGGDTNAQMSVGVTDGTNSVCDSWYQDATRGKQTRTTELAHVYDWNGTVFTDDVVISFDSFTATQFKFNITTVDVNRQLFIEVWG